MTLRCPTAEALILASGHLAPLPLDFAVVGLNHQTAPVEVRERAAVRAGEEGALLDHLSRHASEVMLLSTCNRTEVYLAGLSGDPIAAFEGAWGHALDGHLYVYHGEDAAQHLYRVAAGLDSQVIGETQIQGQVKRAWQDARERGLSTGLMNKIAQGALAAGKRVRAETGMADHVVSVSSVAVDLARTALGGLEDKAVLVLGAGETAELTLTHLRAAGVRDVTVVNRTAERARQLAERFGGRTCAADLLHEALPHADVVIASSAAPHYVLTAAGVEHALQARPERPMVLIDISVPRILDPAIADVAGAHLRNMDDLSAVVRRSLDSRRAALPQAEMIIREQTADLGRWHLTRGAQLARRDLAHACD
ncbi:glutamyl-tRNA reductase [Deinococcus metalli]|uniref:Glutamyl-tRNA reductase n=1 Tax=Deinococcus metalli TaxID=1141878 RepID=A0A7W8NMX0_9DEIO|nr:glutamyl-tRNA reductase [Deinococcus metalli]MBB5376264.1 glutamyl-tRNA reductase [Deinococcus metalli]GHF39619.1 glutamyl-tRNA reductase [Deinococcus metalli]